MKLKQEPKDEKQAANQQMVKEANLMTVFDLIQKRGPVSRAELAQITRLSPTTVSSLVSDLLQNGIVTETGAGTTATSGRKPIMLELAPRGGFVISLEMLENGYSCHLYDLQCREIDKMRICTADYASIGVLMEGSIGEILTRNRIPEEKLLGLCIGVPGLVDVENRKVLSSTVLPLNEGHDFVQHIGSRFPGIPVMVENESSLCAYAEMEFGTSPNIRNLVFIDINVGIGAGIILDGHMFYGSGGYAGEVGHMSIDWNGPRCKCGNRGCLEIMAGIPAMVQKVTLAILSGRETAIKQRVQGDLNRITVEIIQQALASGDPLAEEVVDEAAQALACGINNILNLFNPQAVVIGGIISVLGEVFMKKMKAVLEAIALKSNLQKADIRYSALDSNPVTLGGARYVLDRVFCRQAIG